MNLNTPFSDVMPALSSAGYAALKADIEQNGLVKSILIDEDNNILDGHHRYRACTEIDAEIRTEICRDLRDSDSKRLRILALNLTERQLSSSARERLSNEQKRLALKMLEAGRGVREVARIVGRPHPTIISWRDSARGQADHSEQPTITIAKSVFATGDIKPKAPDMTPDEQKAKTLELAASGVRNSDIASALGIHPVTVRTWIADPDSKVRKTGGGSPRKIDDERAIQLFDSGMSREEIAAELGVHRGTVSECFRRLGIGRSGKKALDPLADHISLAGAHAGAWIACADALVATASVSAHDRTKELISALGRLSKAAANLKHRLNKEVEGGE